MKVTIKNITSKKPNTSLNEKPLGKKMLGLVFESKEEFISSVLNKEFGAGTKIEETENKITITTKSMLGTSNIIEFELETKEEVKEILTEEEVKEIKDVITEEGETEVTLFTNVITGEKELVYGCFSYENAVSLAGLKYNDFEDNDEMMKCLTEVNISKEIWE